MNRDEILNMPAGKKMNQLIWWKVFDMKPTPKNNDMNFLPDYSGDMNVAFAVAGYIHKMINETTLNDCNYLTLDGLGVTSGYAASFDCNLGNEWYEEEEISKYKFSARGNTAPLAICRAALLAVMEAK